MDVFASQRSPAIRRRFFGCDVVVQVAGAFEHGYCSLGQCGVTLCDGCAKCVAAARVAQAVEYGLNLGKGVAALPEHVDHSCVSDVGRAEAAVPGARITLRSQEAGGLPYPQGRGTHTEVGRHLSDAHAGPRHCRGAWRLLCYRFERATCRLEESDQLVAAVADAASQIAAVLDQNSVGDPPPGPSRSRSRTPRLNPPLMYPGRAQPPLDSRGAADGAPLEEDPRRSADVRSDRSAAR